MTCNDLHLFQCQSFPMPESRVFHPLDIHARVLKCMLGSRIFLHVLCVLGEFLACTPRKYTSSVRMLQRQMKACKAEVSKDNIGRQPRETVRSSKPRPNSCSICATKSLWHWHRLDRNRFRCKPMQHFSHAVTRRYTPMLRRMVVVRARSNSFFTLLLDRRCQSSWTFFATNHFRCSDLCLPMP